MLECVCSDTDFAIDQSQYTIDRDQYRYRI